MFNIQYKKVKKYILLVATLAFSLIVTAQSQMKVLHVEDITPELSVYPCGDRPEALVVIRCSESFDLDFTSNVDSELDVTRLTDGSEKIYYIVFQTRASGTTFKGRQLAIIANGFTKYYLPLELKEKQKLEFLVSDPYSKLRSLFYTSTEEGVRLFEVGEYLAAKDQFVIARRCPEYATVENSLDVYVAQCDTMLKWTTVVDMAEEIDDYVLAMEFLEKMIHVNPRCDILRERYSSVLTEYRRECAFDMDVGTRYMEDRKYDLARERFEHAIAIKSPNATQAALNLEQISLINYKADNRTHSFFYEMTGRCPIGFMAASLKPEKVGGYFSLDFNSGCFDLVSNNLEPVSNPEATQFEVVVSGGWTLRLYYPRDNVYIPHVWLLFTPLGYAGGGYTYNEGEGDNIDKSIKYFNAIAPEVGLAVRVWRIALNYKLQYRYVFENGGIGKDILGGVHHSFGIGFCW